MKTFASELKDKAAIVGIGATEFSKDSGRSELRLAVEAIAAALHDAGLTPGDVDGMSTFTIDNNPEIEVNPVPNVEHVVVTAGTGVPTSGLILGRA